MNHSLYRAALKQFIGAGYLSESLLDTVAASGDSPKLASYLRQGSIPETVFAETMSVLWQVPILSTDQLPDEAVANTDNLAAFFYQQEVLPVQQSTTGLQVAMVDPSDEFALRVLQSKYNCSVIPFVATRSDILTALSHLYRQAVDGQTSKTINSAAINDIESESNVVRTVHHFLQRAIASSASDIHFEPYQQSLRVRFRVSGVLHNAGEIEQANTAATIARIKLMAGLDVTQRRRAQDGRFKFPANGQLIDLRVSTMPLHNGESAVFRLLDSTLGRASLNELGYRASVVDSLLASIQQRHGLILLTGPTGSGKSTTLYALLNQLDLRELKVISIEDPVEIAMDGVNQIQVDDEHGISFATALRSVLRQDPDVIMVGEIRDSETAKLAAQAALTGHLVLTTLHTNNAIETVVRLRDFGLPDYLISATVKTIVAQRLVRLCCTQCDEARAVVCTQCGGSGYYGRTAIAEVLPSLAGVDWSDPSSGRVALLKPMLLDEMDIADDATRLLASGQTDELERLRVIGDDLILERGAVVK